MSTGLGVLHPYPDFFDRIYYNIINYNINNDINNNINNINNDINNDDINDIDETNNIHYILNVARTLNFDDIDNIDANVVNADDGTIGEQNLNQLIPINLNELQQLATTNECCSICLEHYETNLSTPNVCRLGCSHHFHTNCLSQWLITHHTCPLCRTGI